MAEDVKTRSLTHRGPGRLRSTRLLVGCGLLLAFLIAAATALLIRDLHKRAIETARANLFSLSAVLDEQADRAIQAMDLVQQAVADEVRLADIQTEQAFVAHMSQRKVHDALRGRIATIPQANAVTVVGADGNVLNFTRYWPIPAINVSDREYFQVLKNDVDRQVFISRPMQNRGDGAWTVFNARKISAPDGRFLGLVLGGIDLHYFEQLYARVAPSPKYVFSLYRDDGVLLAVQPPRPDRLGQTLDLWGRREATTEHWNDVIFRGISPLDGHDRLIAVRRLTRNPLILRISLPVSAALASWMQQATILAGAATLIEIGVAGIVVLGLLQLRSQERLSEAAEREEAERTRGEEKLRAQSEIFGTALDNMTQGLCMFDGADQLIVMNERFARMYALPESLRRKGTKLAAIAGHIAAEEGALTMAAFKPTGADAPSTPTFELGDGRVIHVTYAPIREGGFVCTHEDVTERKQSEARLRHVTEHDSLTGLPNRLKLHRHMTDLLHGIDRGTAAAALCIDLDGFRYVNDTLGHPVGDQVLRFAAQLLRNEVRKTDFVVRLGGDEFAIITTTGEESEEMAQLADRLIARLKVPFEVAGQRIEIGACIGIAVASAATMSADELLRGADVALSGAKAIGPGTWRFFQAEMDLDIKRRRALTQEMKDALARDQFELFYQPLVRARSEQLTGFEALLRWRHPERGIIGPAEFIPIAEASGLIRTIGAWVLCRACRDAMNWPAFIKVAVNLSSVQFSDGELVAHVEQALTQAGLEPGRLELEITESVLLDDTDDTMAQLQRLRALGVRICMDDFGTGYSSLGYLRRFPFDKIKVDQSFVRTMSREQGSIAILRAVIGLGKALGISVLAEGIETREQRDILCMEGYDELQGYFYGHPQPCATLENQFPVLRNPPVPDMPMKAHA